MLFQTRNCLHDHKYIHAGLRTAIQMILCLMPMGLVLMGPDCSSWTVISRGTSWRPPHNFWGNLTLPWIQQANLMISRFLICTSSVYNCNDSHLLKTKTKIYITTITGLFNYDRCRNWYTKII